MLEGLFPILINNYVCEHLFVAYVDQNWQARQVIADENHPYRLMLVDSPMHSGTSSLISGAAEVTH